MLLLFLCYVAILFLFNTKFIKKKNMSWNQEGDKEKKIPVSMLC